MGIFSRSLAQRGDLDLSPRRRGRPDHEGNVANHKRTRQMSLTIGIAAETLPGERRLPVVPDVVKKYQGLGARIVMQKGAGKQAHYRDDTFADVEFVDSAEKVFAMSDIVCCVQPPPADLIAAMQPGSVLVGLLQPWSDAERALLFARQQVTAFAMELLPRISRAQAQTELPAMQLSFMSESRRLDNRRMKRELRLQLRYPQVQDGLV